MLKKIMENHKIIANLKRKRFLASYDVSFKFLLQKIETKTKIPNKDYGTKYEISET